MGRALSWSLAAHLAFIASFLMLSATRPPLTIPQIARPVRLVTYLEPPAPQQRAAPVVAPDSPRPPPASVGPREPVPPAASAPPAAVAVPSPPTASRVVIPVREKAPAPTRAPPPQAEARPALGERLARRLATSAPPKSGSAETAPPQIASLPPAEAAAIAPIQDHAVATAPPGPVPAVDSVGYFPHAWYLALLKEKVFARWTPPSDYFQSRRPPLAVVSFRIDRAGRIGDVVLKEGSGSARFDKSALAAIQGLGAVAPLPEQYREEMLDVVIRFQNQR